MCGIAGIYSNKDYCKELSNMNAVLRHRGINSQSEWIETPIMLAHSRLSVVDTSDVATQPMLSKCENFVIVFNGEVYNYKDLSNKLISDFPEKYSQNTFKTNSDTEIVLEMFACYGVESVKLLNGMFAFAIYDRCAKKIFLFRDRIGIKPLFYTICNDGLFFASELKSLMCALKKKTFNKEALPLFLHLGYYPEPYTAINEAKKFPSAHYAVFDGNELKFNQYWNTYKHINKRKISFDEATKEYNNLLEKAISKTLICDVPFGIFLSGGIDSSLVAATAAKLYDGKIKTFSISSSDPKHDERVFAKEVARILDTEYFEHELNEQNIFNSINFLMDKFDEPFADSSFFPTYILSKFAKEHVTVALSGDGGDELFLGYGSYIWAKRLNSFFVKICLPILRVLYKNKRYAQFFNPKISQHFKSNIFSIEQNLFTSWDLENIGLKLPLGFSESSNSNNKLSAAEEQSFFDLNYYLKDDLLVKVDRASMLAGIEVRPPLLDHNLIEFALSLPENHKLKKKSSKRLLKKVLSLYFPENFFNRQKKGFSIPMQRWLNAELENIPKKYLRGNNLRIYSVVSSDFIADVLDKYNSKKHEWYYNRVWALSVLSCYLENNLEIEIEKQ